MTHCLICNNTIEPFISFGKQPLGNGFLSEQQFSKEYFFELKACFCNKCNMVQLAEQPDPKQMFNENYAFFSGTSKHMALHFSAFADQIQQSYLTKPDPFVVEIGSNDGIMLKNFVQKGIRNLGIEPSANVAKVAKEQHGVNSICEFFNEETAKKIVKEHGHADAFLGANVMCHISDFNSVIKGIAILLKPDGVVAFEDPYLGDVVQKTSYDQFYDEHVFLFSASSVKSAFERQGLELIDLIPVSTHGGSMRYVLAKKGSRPVSPSVALGLEKEKKQGLTSLETFHTFRKNCEKSRDELLKLLKSLKAQNKRVVGYAATSKSTTIINYCGITPDLVEFISDTTPIKLGKYSPGGHIPVLPHDKFKTHYPDYALLFGWNHKNEIMEKEKDFISNGGHWIVYVPKVEII